jgi:Rrf2 family protein
LRLEISKKTDLAIRAMEELCVTDNGLVGGARLAEKIGTSRHRVPQVMRPLVRRAWVESVPGPHGGYRLITKLSEVSLLDVIETVEGSIPEDRCVLRGAPCPSPEPCALHVPWSRAREALLSELENTPVTEVDCRARNGGG